MDYSIVLKVAPVLLIFVLGIILRRINAITEETADSFLRFVFYVSFPASILLSITNIKFSLELIYLPITAASIIIISYFAAKKIGVFFKLSQPAFGVFLVGSMIINTGFTYPFFIAAYGQDGFARAALFDFGNGLLVLSFVYFIAIKYGTNQESTKIVKKFMTSSPLWALLIAFMLNFTQLKLPAIAVEFLNLLSDTLIPLFMISLGIRFTPRIVNPKALISAILIRMFFGLLLGIIFVNIFRLDGLNKIVVLVSSAAPVGLNTLTFATMENLDTEFAASLVSISVLIGIILTTVLISVLS